VTASALAFVAANVTLATASVARIVVTPAGDQSHWTLLG
jgi:hypothetical protein